MPRKKPKSEPIKIPGVRKVHRDHPPTGGTKKGVSTFHQLTTEVNKIDQKINAKEIEKEIATLEKQLQETNVNSDSDDDDDDYEEVEEVTSLDLQNLQLATENQQTPENQRGFKRKRSSTTTATSFIDFAN